jgi:hypothetical protein
MQDMPAVGGRECMAFYAGHYGMMPAEMAKKKQMCALPPTTK